MRWRCLSVVLALLAPPAWADEFDGHPTLTTDQLAKVRAQQEMLRHQAAERVRSGDSFDNNQAARHQMRDSLDQALEENGVDKKQYLHQLTRATRDERAEIEGKVKELKQKARDEKEGKVAEPPPKPEPAPVPEGPEVVKGFRDGESITIPSKLDTNGDRTPEIVLGFDESHPPSAPEAGASDAPKSAPAPEPSP